MKRKRIIPLLILIVIGTLAFAFYSYFQNERTPDRIYLSGHIEVSEVDLSFRLPGHVSRLLVDEGHHVEKGDLLAELAPAVFEARRDQARARVREMEARRDSLMMVIRIKEEVAAGDVKKAQAGVSAARARYESLKSGSRIEEIRAAAAALERARVEYLKRKSDFERTERLFKRQIVSASKFEEARTAYDAARASLESAREHYNLVEAGPRTEMVQEGRAMLSGSAATLNVIWLKPGSTLHFPGS
ncbi:MAG: biotin/lipoyl-binding protein [Deltaproteobacteria bacterium]|nr:biotin/lipoyl-binding protein [Deltaproteobacteria bacterium]